MKSLVNRFKELEKWQNISFEVSLENFERDFYKLKNENADLKEEIKELKYQLKSIKEDDKNCLKNLSKKMVSVLKVSGEEELIKQITLERAKIIDHFTLAYLAESGANISQVKLVQDRDALTGSIEMYFEKKTSIIL